MTPRSVKAIYPAVSAPMGELITYRAMPTHHIEHLDPFLFVNHHGPQVYPPHNPGLPFGPHPHRGFETLTYILEGDIMHWDSDGHQSVIGKGGIQWMTAGRGLIHSEISSETFRKEGGTVEVIQLWLNLSAAHKMVAPAYQGLAEEELTHFSTDEERVRVHLISGTLKGHKGPARSLENLTMCGIEFQEGGTLSLSIPSGHQILFYLVKGDLRVNQREVSAHQIVEFTQEGESLDIEATASSYLIFGHGKPHHEPIVAQGPFVMNTQAELVQAYRDYQEGKMGRWED